MADCAGSTFQCQLPKGNLSPREEEQDEIRITRIIELYSFLPEGIVILFSICSEGFDFEKYEYVWNRSGGKWMDLFVIWRYRYSLSCNVLSFFSKWDLVTSLNPLIKTFQTHIIKSKCLSLTCKTLCDLAPAVCSTLSLVHSPFYRPFTGFIRFISVPWSSGLP